MKKYLGLAALVMMTLVAPLSAQIPRLSVGSEVLALWRTEVCSSAEAITEMSEIEMALSEGAIILMGTVPLGMFDTKIPTDKPYASGHTVVNTVVLRRDMMELLRDQVAGGTSMGFQGLSTAWVCGLWEDGVEVSPSVVFAVETDEYIRHQKLYGPLDMRGFEDAAYAALGWMDDDLKLYPIAR